MPRHPARGCASLLPSLTAALVACASLAFAATGGRTDDRPTRLEVWDLPLGAQAEQLPDAFVDYACGTNGGPPSTPLTGWREVRRCRPEPSGLREVYFRYDDELEYWAKANNLLPQMEQYSGTKTYGFPVTVSALIDEGGTLRGIRLVSDPRGDTQNRDEAYLLRNFLTARFGRDGWACESLPPEDGGRGYLREGAMPQGHRREDHRLAHDAASAQGRPEPVRSAHRPRDGGTVRKFGAPRIGAGQVAQASHNMTCHARESGHPVFGTPPNEGRALVR